MSINKVVITGRLTRDAELRATASGTEVLGIPLAVNERRRNPQTGEWEDYANFVDCKMFGPRAAAVAQLLLKGAQVAVDGKLRYSSWEREGQRRSKLEVVVDDIEVFGAKPKAAAAEDAGGAAEPDYAEEEIPF